MAAEHLQLFHVEDDDDDNTLFARAVGRTGLPITVEIALDGVEALNLLKQAASSPDIILLDIKLPGMDGLQVLAQIKKRRELNGIPVVMFTTSSYRRDRARCFEMGAAGYACKPNEYLALLEFLEQLYEAWRTDHLDGGWEWPCEKPWVTVAYPKK